MFIQPCWKTVWWCKENYSLAIGSSHCIQCPNNNNLALFIFFAAAGFLLVFFISLLNLTVTQGMINGLIFYANIVWSYQSILLPQVESNPVLAFLRTFIAWLNLDFGIQVAMFCQRTGCLLEDMVTVPFPILHLEHCRSYYYWCKIFCQVN